MPIPQTKYSLSNKFKWVVYLTDRNTQRTINFARYFAKDLNVLYVTCESDNLRSLYHPNVEIFDFKSVLNRMNRLIFDFNCYRLYQKIEAIRKSDDLRLREILIFICDLKYSGILEHFPGAVVHLDLQNPDNEDITEKLIKKQMALRVKSMTASNNYLKNAIKPYFKSVFRIPDGVEYQKTTSPEPGGKHEINRPLTGCYCSDPTILDYELIAELARQLHDNTFVFVSQAPFNKIIQKPNNLIFLKPDRFKDAFDAIILPYKNMPGEHINQLLYENIDNIVPIMALTHDELLPHKNILKLYNSKTTLMLALEGVNNIKDQKVLEKSILLQACSWHARCSQIESIILSQF